MTGQCFVGVALSRCLKDWQRVCDLCVEGCDHRVNRGVATVVTQFLHRLKRKVLVHVVQAGGMCSPVESLAKLLAGCTPLALQSTPGL